MIFICIPVHDEERAIGMLLWKVRKVMAELNREYLVLVLDDASTDGSGDLLEKYAKVMPIRLLRSKTRLGYAQAVERLLRAAADQALYPKRDAIVTLQGDFTESPEDLGPLIKTLEGGADIVAGVQDAASAASLPRRVRWTRRLAPFVLGPAYRQAPASDPLSGFRAYRVVVLRKLFREYEEGLGLQGGAWAVSAQLLLLTAPHARRIEEVPVVLRYDRQVRASRFHPFRTVRALLDVRGSRPDRSAA